MAWRWGSSRRHEQLPAGWPRLVAKVKARDGGLCQRCTRPGTAVDHIIPASSGGGDDLDNLQLLCDTCHQRKTLLEANAASAMKRNNARSAELKDRLREHPGYHGA